MVDTKDLAVGNSDSEDSLPPELSSAMEAAQFSVLPPELNSALTASQKTSKMLGLNPELNSTLAAVQKASKMLEPTPEINSMLATAQKASKMLEPTPEINSILATAQKASKTLGITPELDSRLIALQAGMPNAHLSEKVSRVFSNANRLQGLKIIPTDIGNQTPEIVSPDTKDQEHKREISQLMQDQVSIMEELVALTKREEKRAIAAEKDAAFNKGIAVLGIIIGLVGAFVSLL